jgi:hypothetical protein
LAPQLGLPAHLVKLHRRLSLVQVVFYPHQQSERACGGKSLAPVIGSTPVVRSAGSSIAPFSVLFKSLIGMFLQQGPRYILPLRSYQNAAVVK